MPGRAREFLADDRTHGPAHEGKLECTNHDRATKQSAGRRHERVLLAGLLLGRRDTIAIALAVAELQGIFRFETRRDLLDGPLVEEHLEAMARADAHVMSALGADQEVALELLAIQLRIALGALDPHALGHRPLAILGADARRHQFL